MSRKRTRTPTDLQPGQRYVTTKGFAAYAGVSVDYAERRRWDGTGPTYSKVGGIILYDLQDIDCWIDQHKRSSTSALVPCERADSPRRRSAPVGLTEPQG